MGLLNLSQLFYNVKSKVESSNASNSRAFPEQPRQHVMFSLLGKRTRMYEIFSSQTNSDVEDILNNIFITYSCKYIKIGKKVTRAEPKLRNDLSSLLPLPSALQIPDQTPRRVYHFVPPRRRTRIVPSKGGPLLPTNH